MLAYPAVFCLSYAFGWTTCVLVHFVECTLNTGYTTMYMQFQLRTLHTCCTCPMPHGCCPACLCRCWLCLCAGCVRALQPPLSGGAAERPADHVCSQGVQQEQGPGGFGVETGVLGWCHVWGKACWEMYVSTGTACVDVSVLRVWVWVYVCDCVWVWVWVRARMFLWVCIFVCAHLRLDGCGCVCLCVWACVCGWVFFLFPTSCTVCAGS